MKKIYLISLLLFLQNITNVFDIYSSFRDEKISSKDSKVFFVQTPTIATYAPIIQTPIIMQLPKIAEVKTETPQASISQTKAPLIISHQTPQMPLVKPQNKILTNKANESKVEGRLNTIEGHPDAYFVKEDEIKEVKEKLKFKIQPHQPNNPTTRYLEKKRIEIEEKLAELENKYAQVSINGETRVIDVTDPENRLIVKNIIDNTPDDALEYLQTSIKKTEYWSERFAKKQRNQMMTLSTDEFLKNPNNYKTYAGFKEKIQEIVETENPQTLQKLISSLDDESILDNYQNISQSNNFHVVHKLEERIIKLYNNDPAKYSFWNPAYWYTTGKPLSKENSNKCAILYQEIKERNKLAKYMCAFFEQYFDKQERSASEKKQFLSFVKKLQEDKLIEKKFSYVSEDKLNKYEIEQETIKIIDSIEGLDYKKINKVSEFLNDYISKTEHTKAEEKKLLIMASEIAKDKDLEAYIKFKFNNQLPFIKQEISRIQNSYLKALGFSADAIKFAAQRSLDPLNFIKPLMDPEQKAIQTEIINFYNDLGRNAVKFRNSNKLKSLAKTISHLANAAAELNCEGQTKEAKTCLLSGKGLLDFCINLPVGLYHSIKDRVDMIRHWRETLTNLSYAAQWLAELLMAYTSIADYYNWERLDIPEEDILTIQQNGESIIDALTKAYETLKNASPEERGKIIGRAIGDFYIIPGILKAAKATFYMAKTECILYRVESFKLNRWLDLSPSEKLACARKMPHATLIVESLKIIHDQQLAAKMAQQIKNGFEAFCAERNLTGHIDTLISAQQMEKRIKDLCYMFKDPMHIYEEACELKKIASQFGGKSIQLKFQNATNELHNQVVKFSKNLDHPLIADVSEVLDKKILGFGGCHCPNIEKLKASGLLNIEILEKVGSKVVPARVTVGGVSQTKTLGLWSKDEYIKKVMESLRNLQHFDKVQKGSKTTIKLWGYDKEGILFETMVVKNKIESSYPCSKSLKEILKTGN